MNKIGHILTESGTVFSNEKLAIVHKTAKANEIIPTHNHPDEEIFFTCVSGSLEVTLGGTEIHKVKPGMVLHFDGKNTITATAIEDSQVFVFLLQK